MLLECSIRTFLAARHSLRTGSEVRVGCDRFLPSSNDALLLPWFPTNDAETFEKYHFNLFTGVPNILLHAVSR